MAEGPRLGRLRPSLTADRLQRETWPPDRVLPPGGLAALRRRVFLASQKIFDLTLFCGLLSVAADLSAMPSTTRSATRWETHVFEKGRLRFVKHDHLMAAKAFYDRHGGKAIILARFVRSSDLHASSSPESPG